MRSVLVVLLAVAVLGGCRAKPAWQGRGDVLAVYQFSTLTAEFPERVAVPAVIASADAALRGRGYSVTRLDVTKDEGSVVAKAPDPGVLEKVVVQARLSRLGTRVSLRMDPLGGEAQARAILDDMLVRLGY